MYEYWHYWLLTILSSANLEAVWILDQSFDWFFVCRRYRATGTQLIELTFSQIHSYIRSFDPIWIHLSSKNSLETEAFLSQILLLEVVDSIFVKTHPLVSTNILFDVTISSIIALVTRHDESHGAKYSLLPPHSSQLRFLSFHLTSSLSPPSPPLSRLAHCSCSVQPSMS